MKKVLAVLLPLTFATASWAGDDAVIHWQRIGSGGPWTVSTGKVIVDLTRGDAAFFVEGLVLVGGNSSGTPGPVTTVKGTLVCDAGASDQAVIDTPAVALDAQGNAAFHGDFASAPPDPCTNPIFLIRASPANVWIATAAVRYTRP